ncbi:hypothetical protein C9374_011292 [Naegleria lovaniensis]|uniref:Uncharacterized protein n=1 Tax=Naegleria lovaniensis TaxID=51637 RepID=A0AA88H3V0_NAELO|nr:uncharacterized protein C9374_011292 [Naegleria lovaniensis]KAG2392567.1 hypothetical protein C9374_011292 [Naegleria lovaniensis]
MNRYRSPSPPPYSEVENGFQSSPQKHLQQQYQKQRDYYFSDLNSSSDQIRDDEELGKLDISSIADDSYLNYSSSFEEYSAGSRTPIQRSDSLPSLSPSKNSSRMFQKAYHNREASEDSEHSCQICGTIFTNYSYFLEHMYGGGKCSELFEQVQQTSKHDSLFTSHYRNSDDITHRVKIEHLAFVSSLKDQFSFHGKNACTSVACEFAVQMLHGVVDTENPRAWNASAIDRIVESGCQQDPKLGNLSFEEVYSMNDRVNSNLELVHEVQNSVKGSSFKSTLETIENCSQHLQKPVCAIFTKQPETVVLFFNTNTGIFILADSHPRETDGTTHGASLCFTKSLRSMATVLKHWLFPFMNFDESAKGLSEMYNSFSCSIVKLRPCTTYSPTYSMTSKKTTSNVSTPLSKQSPSRTLQRNTNHLSSPLQKENQSRDLAGDMSALKSENDKLLKQIQLQEEKIQMLQDKLNQVSEQEERLKTNNKQYEQLSIALKGIEEIIENVSPIIQSLNSKSPSVL